MTSNPSERELERALEDLSGGGMSDVVLYRGALEDAHPNYPDNPKAAVRWERRLAKWREDIDD